MVEKSRRKTDIFHHEFSVICDLCHVCVMITHKDAFYIGIKALSCKDTTQIEHDTCFQKITICFIQKYYILQNSKGIFQNMPNLCQPPFPPHPSNELVWILKYIGMWPEAWWFYLGNKFSITSLFFLIPHYTWEDDQLPILNRQDKGLWAPGWWVCLSPGLLWLSEGSRDWWVDSHMLRGWSLAPLVPGLTHIIRWGWEWLIPTDSGSKEKDGFANCECVWHLRRL